MSTNEFPSSFSLGLRSSSIDEQPAMSVYKKNIPISGLFKISLWYISIFFLL